MEPRPTSLLIAGAFTLAAAAVLIGLGVWQLERLAWKNEIVARIAQRANAAAKPLPPQADWPQLVAGDHEYERFAVTGFLEATRETLIYRSTGKVAGAQAQPGYWVMLPLLLADGSRVLVNRGFIALASKDRSKRAEPDRAEVTITGLLRLTEPRGYFTPPDNPAKAEWFTRDINGIAAALKLESVAPFSIDQDAHIAAPGLPAGGATVIDIPNNHLSYALTWFGLAAALGGVFTAFAMRGRGAAQ